MPDYEFRIRGDFPFTPRECFESPAPTEQTIFLNQWVAPRIDDLADLLRKEYPTLPEGTIVAQRLLDDTQTANDPKNEDKRFDLLSKAIARATGLTCYELYFLSRAESGFGPVKLISLVKIIPLLRDSNHKQTAEVFEEAIANNAEIQADSGSRLEYDYGSFKNRLKILSNIGFAKGCSVMPVIPVLELIGTPHFQGLLKKIDETSYALANQSLQRQTKETDERNFERRYNRCWTLLKEQIPPELIHSFEDFQTNTPEEYKVIKDIRNGFRAFPAEMIIFSNPEEQQFAANMLTDIGGNPIPMYLRDLIRNFGDISDFKTVSVLARLINSEYVFLMATVDENIIFEAGPKLIMKIKHQNK